MDRPAASASCAASRLGNVSVATLVGGQEFESATVEVTWTVRNPDRARVRGYLFFGRRGRRVGRVL